MKMISVELHGGPLDGQRVSVPADAMIYQSNRATGGAYTRNVKKSPDNSRWFWRADNLKDR